MFQDGLKVLYGITLCLFLSHVRVSGQELYIPRASPRASISQYIGVCHVAVDYSRPSTRGRKIFGGLLPYGKVWRAGANEATSISFSHPVMFGDAEVPAGKYGLFMIPQKDRWTVILNKTWDQWGAYHYNPNDDVLSIELLAQSIEHVEMCTYTFTEVTKSKGILNLEWETTNIAIPIETKSHIQTLGEIEKAINNSQEYWYTYSAAAQYHFYEYGEAEIALKYIDVAIALEAPNPAPWMLKSQILASLEQYKEAIVVAEDAIEVCKKQNFAFEIHENEENITKWKGMMKD